MTQMQATIQQDLETMPISGKAKFNLLQILGSIGDRFSSCATSSAGLLISGTNTVAKTGSAVTTFVANGIAVSLAGSTDMPALTGLDISAGAFRHYCFFIDSAAVVTVAAGAEGATRALATFPPFPAGKALIGYLTITYASAFVGGTTPLDTATTNYSSPTGAWDPSVLVGATSY